MARKATPLQARRKRPTSPREIVAAELLFFPTVKNGEGAATATGIGSSGSRSSAGRGCSRGEGREGPPEPPESPGGSSGAAARRVRVRLRSPVRLIFCKRIWPSPEWRRLGICHPDLVFTKDTFLGINTSTDTETASAADFITKVDSVLHPLWSTPTTTVTTLNKFVVEFGLGGSHKYHIDRWISFSTESRAKHVGLVLKLGVTGSAGSEDDKYDVPLSILSGPNGSCVESLDLCYVCLKLPPSFCGIRNLKKLTLHTVSVNISDFQCLLLSCARLESLNIEDIRWLSPDWCYPSLCIHKELCGLQYLRIRHCHMDMIELHAPNLATIDFDDFLIHIVLSESLKVSEATFAPYRRLRWGVHDALAEVFNRVPRDLPHLNRLFLDLGLETSVQSFSKSQNRFMKLRYLNINLRITGIRLPTDTNWVMGLVNLLELTPFLEELEIHINACGHRRGNRRPASRMVKAVRCKDICTSEVVVELALCILGNAIALEQMVVDSQVRNGHGSSDTNRIYSVSKASEFVPPSRDEQNMYGMVMDRKFVKEHLEREEYRHVLTIL